MEAILESVKGALCIDGMSRRRQCVLRCMDVCIYMAVVAILESVKGACVRGCCYVRVCIYVYTYIYPNPPHLPLSPPVHARRKTCGPNSFTPNSHPSPPFPPVQAGQTSLSHPSTSHPPNPPSIHPSNNSHPLHSPPVHPSNHPLSLSLSPLCRQDRGPAGPARGRAGGAGPQEGGGHGAAGESSQSSNTTKQNAIPHHTKHTQKPTTTPIKHSPNTHQTPHTNTPKPTTTPPPKKKKHQPNTHQIP